MEVDAEAPAEEAAAMGKKDLIVSAITSESKEGGRKLGLLRC